MLIDNDDVAENQVIAYRQVMVLRKLRPRHELLRFAFFPDNNEVWEEFMERFSRPFLSRKERGTYENMAYMYKMYFESLKEACDDPEKTIIVVHASQ